MSDARAPAMDVHMTPQDAGMARSFWLILSALLIGDNGYCDQKNAWKTVRKSSPGPVYMRVTDV
jgi:hypothetical protein